MGQRATTAASGFAVSILLIAIAPCAVAQELEPSINRAGSDYAHFDLTTADPVVCQEACQDDNRCRAFTYAKPGVPPAPAHCWLKSAVPPPSEDPRFISGVKLAPPNNAQASPKPGQDQRAFYENVDFPGGNPHCFDLAKPEPALCLAACADDAQCRVFTYVRPGARGPQARCCLNLSVPAPVKDTCCISGPSPRPQTTRPTRAPLRLRPIANEVEWQIGEIARDIAEILIYAKAQHRPAGEVRISVAGEMPNDRIRLQLNADGTLPVVTAVVWTAPMLVASVGYSDLVAKLLAALALGTKPPTDPDPGLLDRLTDFRLPVIAQEARRISDELAKSPLDARLHEEAAFCLASLALAEQAGAFHDPREPIRRATAHLALARGLRAQHGLGPTGFVAEAVLMSLLDRGASARSMLGAATAMAGNVQALSAWKTAVTVKNSYDWRATPSPLTATLLERSIHYRALAARIGPLAALDFLRSRNTTPTVEWSRTALAREFGVEVGNVFTEIAFPLELREISEVAKIHGIPLPMEPKIGRLLGPSSGRCMVGDGDSWKPEVIGWRTWSGHFQRHLMHACYSAYWHYVGKLGLPERAREIRQGLKKPLGDMEMFPLLWARLAWIAGSEATPPDDRPLVEREPGALAAAQDFVFSQPEKIPAVLWGYFVETGPGDRSPPRGLDRVTWFAASGPRRGIAAWVSLDLHWDLLTDGELDYLLREAPTSKQLLQIRARRRHGEAQLTLDQFDALNGELAAFDVPTMWERAELLENDAAAYSKQLRAIAVHDPDALFDLGDYLAARGQDAEAAVVLQEAVEKGRSSLSLAGHCAFVVDYLWDMGRRDDARALADKAAAVYSASGLSVLAHLLERAGKLDGAEEYFKKLRDRYRVETPLRAFYLRNEGKGRYTKEASAARLALFPHGMTRTSLGRLQGPPTAGAEVSKDARGFLRRGIPRGAVIAGLDGYAVANGDQYWAIRSLKDDRRRKIIVWDGQRWREIEGSFGLRYWDWELRDYKPPEAK